MPSENQETPVSGLGLEPIRMTIVKPDIPNDPFPNYRHQTGVRGFRPHVGDESSLLSNRKSAPRLMFTEEVLAGMLKPLSEVDLKQVAAIMECGKYHVLWLRPSGKVSLLSSECVGLVDKWRVEINLE